MEKFDREKKRGEIIGYLIGMILIFLFKSYLCMKRAWWHIVWKG
jgi:hypothetical protein